jgi:signal transduction histidine kinase/response regulator RpfG family c-di-GMP phosphodiesterase
MPEPARTPPESREALTFLAGGGEVGMRMRLRDWSETPLGDPRGWPQSLKTIVRVMLDSRYAMWMLWGPELTFFCNDAYLPTVGLKRDWVLGARSDRVWEEIWPDIGPRIQQVLTHGTATWDEALQLFLERSGFLEETYHTFSYSPVYDDDSHIAGMLCVVTEVTDRVIGERRLRILRDLAGQRAHVESVDEACRRICEVLGQYPLDIPFGAIYLAGSGTSRRVAQLVPSGATSQAVLPESLDHSHELPWPVARLLETQQAQEVSGLPGLGIRIPAAPWPEAVQTALLIPLMGSGAQGMAGFAILGVSPRRPVDDACRSFLNLVAGQTAGFISDQQALQAERRRAEALAELNRAKTEFFSNVSHEFRTPLTLMLGPLEEAQAAVRAALPGQAENLEVAHRNAMRLLKLVNSLLDFSRLESGRVQANLAPLDLAAVTQDLASTFRSAIEKQGIAFSVRCGSGPLVAAVDAEMWEKIVLNLLSNAFKYTESGTIAVELGADATEVTLAISDSGIGIPAGAQAHLFERFYRVPGARGRTHEGSGIGLSLVKEFVEHHGGRVSFSSTEGVGSRFTVTMPRRLEAVALPAPVAARGATRPSLAHQAHLTEAQRWDARPAAPAGPPAGHAQSPAAPGVADRPAILVVDDNADMREYVERLLQPHYRVLTAADGAQALQQLERSPVELVLSDVMMPLLDGFGLLKAVRADPALCDLPVILLSARAGEEARVEGLDAQADDYVVKPFTARELLARIHNQLALRHSRHEAQAAVADSEQRFRAALAASRAGFVVLSTHREGGAGITEFTWTYVNAAAEELIGRRFAQLAGRPVSEALPRAWQTPHLFERLVRVAESGVPADFEAPVRVGATRVTWFHASVARMGDELVLWFANVSDRKRVEAELREVDRRKDEFLATLAHELRNPLAPIRQAAAIARTPGATAVQLNWSQGVIERQVRHMARLLDDLLEVSRITRGTLELRRDLIEVRSVVEAAIETSRPAIDAKSHRLSTRIAPDLPPLYADGLRLAQVLSNLLTNAAKYTDPHGHIELVARVSGGEMHICVADNGIGIERDSQAHIFQMFSQLRPALQRSDGGLGIGLALVKGIVALHGGRVEVHSAGVGCGSEFRVRLPLASATAQAVDDGDAVAARTPDHPQRILVVDDNEDAAESLALLLSLDGHEVRTAHDAEQALTVAADLNPEVAILDIGLPGRNGYELAQDLRRTCDGATRLIALTGWGQSEDRDRAQDAGFSVHLTKPVDPEVLRQVLRGVPAG